VGALTTALRAPRRSGFRLEYPDQIEAALRAATAILEESGFNHPTLTGRALVIQWLAGDPVTTPWLEENLDDLAVRRLQTLRSDTQEGVAEPLPAVFQDARRAWVESVVAESLIQPGSNKGGLSLRLGRLSTHPIWGLFILAAVLYSLYWFVGVFGAGTLVGWLEKNVFGAIVNPWVQGWILRLSPAGWVADLLVGPYGLWTMGMTYALALILPIVTTFFLAFSILEDSGYLPRLAALSNRLFQALGLNGKAVLPMVLGLGCVTMATLTTRILESKRDRLLVTLLLALAVPCSAQLGVVMGMLAGISLGAALIWGAVVLGVLLVVGWLAARLAPGDRTPLLVELPPLRLPQASNVLLKTLTRLEWYVKEVVPLFLAGAALMFLLDRVGALAFLIRLGEPLVSGWLGLPPETSAAFLMGFLRRDFGAAGLFAMRAAGLLTPAETVVSIVTVTLFIPCIASIMMIAKERGWRTAAGMMVLIFPLAFLVGGFLHRGLQAIGWGG
jgi:ferrous iron transport protein B